MGQSLSSLPPEQRAKHYRECAGLCVRRAQDAATEEMRAGHLSMAAGWHSLAVEVEHLMDRFDHVSQDFDRFAGQASYSAGA